MNKCCLLSWAGRSLRFWLSQSLFSSDNIDTGTRALLDVISKHFLKLPVQRVLDLGCGTGVIGVALACLWPQSKVIMSDRDALAVAVSNLNAYNNGVTNATSIGCLGIPHGHESFDLIAANLPAKVGEPVLRMLVRQATAAAPFGYLALVVIRARQDQVENELQGRAHILHRRELQSHIVLLAKTALVKPENNHPSSYEINEYLRGETEFCYGGQSLKLQTVWGLPDFNSVPYALRTAEPLVYSNSLGPRILIWNPGQGLTAQLIGTFSEHPTEITLASRDLLQVAVARHNLRQAGVTVTGVHVPSITHVHTNNKSFTGIIATHTDTDGSWWRWLPEAVSELLEPGGQILLSAGSTPVDRSLRAMQGMEKLQDRRRRGYRAVLLKQRPSPF